VAVFEEIASSRVTCSFGGRTHTSSCTPRYAADISGVFTTTLRVAGAIVVAALGTLYVVSVSSAVLDGLKRTDAPPACGNRVLLSGRLGRGAGWRGR
jgi:hypothetical protein